MIKYFIITTLILFPTLAHANFDMSLKYGSKGESVIELQDFLMEQGLYSGTLDGRYGFGTMKAVKEFQKLNGLKADGFFGKASRLKANEIMDEILKESKETEALEKPEDILKVETPKVEVIKAPVEVIAPVKEVVKEAPKAPVFISKKDMILSKIKYTDDSGVICFKVYVQAYDDNGNLITKTEDISITNSESANKNIRKFDIRDKTSFLNYCPKTDKVTITFNAPKLNITKTIDLDRLEE